MYILHQNGTQKQDQPSYIELSNLTNKRKINHLNTYLTINGPVLKVLKVIQLSPMRGDTAVHMSSWTDVV